MITEVVVMCGIPGSGKSTWRAHNLDPTHVVVSKDLMPRSARRQARQAREIRAAIGCGKPVVVDNTNLTRADRAPLLALAEELGVPSRAVIVMTALDTALARNAQRSGRARVPEGIVRQMASRWEAPTVDEGFDAVTVVTSDGEKPIFERWESPDHLPEHPRVVTAPVLKSSRQAHHLRR